MVQQWFVRIGDVRKGPLSSRELAGMAQSGELRPTDVVKKEGAATWVLASQVKGLFPPSDPNASVVVDAVSIVSSSPAVEPTQRREEGPGQGIWERLTSKLQRWFVQAINRFKETRRRLAPNPGIPYQAEPGHRPLSKVVSLLDLGEGHPWPQNTTLQLVLTNDALLFVESPMFRLPTIRFRLAMTDIRHVRTDRVAPAHLAVASHLVDMFAYGSRDARMFAALEGPPEVPCLVIVFTDPTRYDGMRCFLGIASATVGMSLGETACQLRQIMTTRTVDVESASQPPAQATLGKLREAAIASAQASRATAKPEAAAQETRATPDDILTQIEKLGQLRNKGVVTDEEFQAKKRDLLSRL